MFCAWICWLDRPKKWHTAQIACTTRLLISLQQQPYNSSSLIVFAWLANSNLNSPGVFAFFRQLFILAFFHQEVKSMRLIYYFPTEFFIKIHYFNKTKIHLRCRTNLTWNHFYSLNCRLKALRISVKPILNLRLAAKLSHSFIGTCIKNGVFNYGTDSMLISHNLFNI